MASVPCVYLLVYPSLLLRSCICVTVYSILSRVFLCLRPSLFLHLSRSGVPLSSLLFPVFISLSIRLCSFRVSVSLSILFRYECFSVSVYLSLPLRVYVCVSLCILAVSPSPCHPVNPPLSLRVTLQALFPPTLVLRIREDHYEG